MQTARRARPVQILLVEDNSADADLTQEALREGRIPHELRRTWNGEEALAYLRRQGDFAAAERPDLVLLDLNLPRKDGREVLAEIKADPDLREIPVIVLTTSHAERDVRDAYRLHANSYIVKPVDLEQFLTAVRSIEQFWLQLAALPSGWEAAGALPAAEAVAPPPRSNALPPVAALPLPDGLARVLLVEDNAGDAQLIAEYLSGPPDGRLQVELVGSAAAARERLQRGGVDLVLLDLSLPDSMGLETFTRVFEQTPDVPIVVLSGTADEAVATRAVQAGAQDYLVKSDVDDRLILRTLRYAYERAHTQRQLRTAQKMEAIGRLAGGVAHDFNNMLAVVIGYSDLLLAQAEPGSRVQEDLREVKAAGERAAALTRQLLAFGRKQMISPRLLNLNELVSGMLGMLRHLLPQDLQLHHELAPSVGLVRADPSQLEQVLVNLTMNARDAISGAGRIDISTRSVYVDDGLAREHPGVMPGPFELLCVTDTGSGIDDELKALVFEPFFTTKGPGQGSGLGLASVYGTVRQSGGFVDLESAVGRGSTFRIFLPRAAPDLHAPTRDTAASAAVSPITVLVVEADAPLRQLIVAVLGTQGIAVLPAGDAQEAREHVSRYPGEIDLLLADASLPTGGGPELAWSLRALRPELKVLFMSSHDDLELGLSAEQRSTVVLLEKPFSPTGLLKKVQEGLASSPDV